MTHKNKQSSREFMSSTRAHWWQKGEYPHHYLCRFSFEFSCDIDKVEKETKDWCSGIRSKYVDEVQSNKVIKLVLNPWDWNNQQEVHDAWSKYFETHGESHRGMMFAYADRDFDDMANLFLRFLSGFRWINYVNPHREAPKFSQEELESQHRHREYQEQKREEMNREWDRPTREPKDAFDDEYSWP
jgi:hypothetical protein